MRIYLSRPHMSDAGHERRFVDEAFASNFVAPLGPQLDRFEAEVARLLGPGFHTVGLSSGSAALHLALRLAGVGTGDHDGRVDEVWISSMTFAGGIFPVLYQNARPRFFDLDAATWGIDLERLEEALAQAEVAGRLPRVIVPTDLYGQSVDLARLERIAGRFDVRLILDSAESLGATGPGGRPAGTGGDAAILSFNGNKIITTSGGGMLVTRHAEWAEKARFLATQARDPAPHYEHSTFGYNYRLSNICAAIGLGQLEVLPQRIARRRAIFDRYREALGPRGFDFMPEPEGFRSTRWLTAAILDPARLGIDREAVRLALLEHEIEARPLWKPMHLQPLFEGAPYHGAGVDADLFAKGLCLPSGSDMTDAQQDEVIDRIEALL